jgi:hypothetical protein
MKKTILILSVVFLGGISLNSCGGSEEKNSAKNKAKKGNETVKKEKAEPELKPVISLTKKEALARMKAFLKENSRKYKEYGEVQDMSTLGGSYSKDGALDYFYSVNFYQGGDYAYITHFFYESEQDKIRELDFSKISESLSWVTVDKLTEGKAIGSANLWSPFSGEHDASSSFNAEFTIDGNKINFDKKYLPKFKKAEKEIASKLKKMEEDMMNEADAYNSELAE